MAIWFCGMDFNCSMQWDELNATSDPLVRGCKECGKLVHFVDSQEELDEAAAMGQCVVFYNQEKDQVPPKMRQELKQTWRIDSMGGRLSLGLPRRPVGDKLRLFIDNM